MLYKNAPVGSTYPPAQLAPAATRRAFTGVSGDEVIECLRTDCLSKSRGKLCRRQGRKLDAQEATGSVMLRLLVLMHCSRAQPRVQTGKKRSLI